MGAYYTHMRVCQANIMLFEHKCVHLLNRGMGIPHWRRRLLEEIEQDERSDRKLSLDAGLSQNFVQQMKKRGKNTGVDGVIKLCHALNVSPTYIFTGLEMTSEDDQVLILFEGLSEPQKQYFLGFLKSLREDESAHE